MKLKTTRLLALTLLAVKVASSPPTVAARAKYATPNILLFVVDEMDFTTFNANANGCGGRYESGVILPV